MRPAELAQHYTRFRVAERLLLTGHSHQAWPDVAREGQVEAFDDAAATVDEKWERAFAKADRVRSAYRALLGDRDGDIALGANTHELVIRFLSAVDLAARPRLVTTDGEFHTLRRQLARLAEDVVEVVRVPALPAATLAERLASEVDDRTAAVLVSSVLFETSWIVPNLGELAAACARAGTELLVDAYHALGVVPVSLSDSGLADAWVVGGGYKYLQLGEGNCFLRLPPHAQRMRPVITGWFAEFAALADEKDPDLVAYGPGATRFAGATYDPASHYRAARVIDFFAEHGLTPAVLRATSLHQNDVLLAAFDDLDLPPAVVTRDRGVTRTAFGGFLSLRSPRAAEFQRALADRGVSTDSRGEYLRFGPAPYLSDDQLRAAIAALGEVAVAATPASVAVQAEPGGVAALGEVAESGDVAEVGDVAGSGGVAEVGEVAGSGGVAELDDDIAEPGRFAVPGEPAESGEPAETVVPGGPTRRGGPSVPAEVAVSGEPGH